ncbi:MAG: polymer-forming cytoskeletal protein, partial [Pseudomonadota bacterium]
MFSKSKINEPGPSSDAAKPDAPAPAAPAAAKQPAQSEFKASAPKAKPPASVLSADLHVTGNMKTTGDINVEGTVEGDIRAHLLTIGESATIKGEVTADDVVINGRIVGRVRG